MRDNFFVGRDFMPGIHLRQLVSGFEEALRVEIVRPFEMNCSGNGATSLRTYKLARVLGIASCIDNHSRRNMQSLQYIVGCRNPVRPWFHLEIAGFWNRGFLSDRQAYVPPGMES